MFKISICGVALFLAGLVACSNQSGLNVTGGSTSGGQGTSGTGGSTGGGQTTGQNDCEKAGGTCEQGAPGACLGGWSPNTGGYSCASSTTSCCLPLSYSPCETAGGTCTQVQPGSCPSGTIDDTSQYQCSNMGGPTTCCMPSANGGVSGTGGTSGGAGSSGATGGSGGVGGVGSGGTSGAGGTVSCLPALCSITMPACAGEFQPNPDDPCGCPICVPKPDAGIAKDAGSPDSPICLGSMLPCVPPPKTCPAGYQMLSQPCGCGGCVPVDGGTSDAGKPDTPVICYVMCPMMACTYGHLPTPAPCGCPSCAPAPDAGVAKDAGRADTPLPVCPMLANLNSTDAAAVSWGSGRMLLECKFTGGTTEDCLSNDVTGCPGPVMTSGDLVGCSDLCAADEYGLSYGGVGPLAAPPSIDLPTGCGSGRYTPAGVAFYCCPCGLLTVPL
jgi:hypothetical protein